MEFRLLGPVEVVVGGRALAIGSGRQRALIALLLLHLGEVVSRDTIVDELWGEQPPASVVKALQVHISQLRKLLPAGLLVTRAPGYTIDAAPETLDAARFEAMVSDGRATLGRGDAEAAGAALRAALALWRGPALADAAFGRLAIAEAARLDELRLSALEARIDADLACGVADLTSELEGLVLRTPLRERVWGQLMLALYREDRQAEALAAFQEARRTLVDELGIEPGDSLRALNDAILAQDPALTRPAVAPRQDGDELIGRRCEQAALAEALAGAYRGAGAVCLVSGEAGVGKSRLVEWLANEALRQGAVVVSGRCWESGGAPAYWPWIEALRAYERMRGFELIRGAGADLQRLLPDLAPADGGVVAEVQDEDPGARFRLFESVARALVAASTKDPVVLVLEDLHAADAPSLLLLEFVARRASGARLLVIGTYREHEVGLGATLANTVAQLARDRATLRVRLSGLSEDDVARLVEILSGAPAAPCLLRRFWSDTAGNPLFVGELVRLLAGKGEADRSVPTELRTVILRRLAQLPADARRALDAAAVLGREFSLAGLAGVLECPRPDLLDLLEAPGEANLIESVPRAAGRRRFAHGLVRDAVYAELRAADRRRLHGRAGAVLEQLHADELDVAAAELAHHFAAAADAGGDPVPAVRYATLAGHHARRMLAYEEAVRQFRLALACAEDLPVEERCDLLLALADAHGRAGETEASRVRFRAAAQLAQSAGLKERQARAALGHAGRFLWERATDREMLPLLEAATDALESEHPALRAQLLARRAAALRPGLGMSESVREQADALAAQALELARQAGDPNTLAYTLEGSLRATSRPGRAQAHLPVAAEIRALARTARDKEREYAGNELALLAEWELGDGAAIDARLLELDRMADMLRQPAQQWAINAFRVIRAVSRGDLEEAARRMAAAAEHGREAALVQARISSAMHAFSLARAAQHSHEATDTVEAALREFPQYVALACARVHALAAAGEQRPAARALASLATGDFAAIPHAENWMFSVALLAEACVILGDVQHAPALLRRLHPHRAAVAIGPPDGCTDAVAMQLGALSELLGDAPGAREYYALAVEVNDRLGASPARKRAAAALAALR